MIGTLITHPNHDCFQWFNMRWIDIAEDYLCRVDMMHCKHLSWSGYSFTVLLPYGAAYSMSAFAFHISYYHISIPFIRYIYLHLHLHFPKWSSPLLPPSFYIWLKYIVFAHIEPPQLHSCSIKLKLHLLASSPKPWAHPATSLLLATLAVVFLRSACALHV